MTVYQRIVRAAENGESLLLASEDVAQLSRDQLIKIHSAEDDDRDLIKFAVRALNGMSKEAL